MTDMRRSERSWQGETGVINQAMIAQHLTRAVSPFYYLAGPQGMVRAMRIVLHAMEVDEGDIWTEEFVGY